VGGRGTTALHENKPGKFLHGRFSDAQELG